MPPTRPAGRAQYRDAGWQVIATCRDPSGAADLQSLRAGHASLDIEPLDVGDFGSIDALASRLAGRPIDVLLNNAGVFGPKAAAERDLRQSFGTMDYDIWSQVLRVNLMAPLKLAETLVANVAASTQKKLVAISSTEGSSPNARGGLYAYRTSKAALNMLVQNLAAELAPRGIVTAAFCPGWIRTRMGGPNAPLEAPPSIAGIRRVIDGLTPTQSGRFWLWNGQPLPW